MAYDAANGDHLYKYTNISTVADTIHLQCHRGLKIRSRLELAKSCSSEVACRAIRTKERTTSIWCACPQKITWPRSWNYILSTVRLRNLMEPLPGMKFGEAVVRWDIACSRRQQFWQQLVAKHGYTVTYALTPIPTIRDRACSCHSKLCREIVAWVPFTNTI